MCSGGRLVRTTWYGDNFERVVEGSTEKFYHWINSPDGPVALVIKVTGGATTIYYLCTDHLNSITGVMNSTGNMQEEYSYDPWGRRRSPVNWSTSSVTMPVITNRGFTGHEHLDAFGLIHMNGRLYDPHLARVLNPDPIIQDPTDIQNYNRYSYCLNNPMKYLDPSGYSLYKQYMDKQYGEGNYYYRGRGPKLRSYEEYMSCGTGGGGVGGYSGLPYQGDNGSGNLGFYFDYYSGTYRNTETGTQVPNITYLVYAYGPNLPIIFRGVIFQNGTSWYTEDGPYPATMDNMSSNVDPINYFISTYGKSRRAGGGGNEMVSGMVGSLDLVSVAAGKGLSRIALGASTGGLLISIANIYKIVDDIQTSNTHRYGDLYRLGLNIFYAASDFVVPFSGFFPAATDSYGLFEYSYHQMDVLEDTGYWVYYNWYNQKWRSIKLK